MEITRESLEGKIVNIREQARQAAAVVQQVIGAEVILLELLADLRKEENVQCDPDNPGAE